MCNVLTFVFIVLFHFFTVRLNLLLYVEQDYLTKLFKSCCPACFKYVVALILLIQMDECSPQHVMKFCRVVEVNISFCCGGTGTHLKIYWTSSFVHIPQQHSTALLHFKALLTQNAVIIGFSLWF